MLYKFENLTQNKSHTELCLLFSGFKKGLKNVLRTCFCLGRSKKIAEE